MFFGAAPELDRYLEVLGERIADDGLKFAVLRLRRVRNPDAVCIEHLEKFLRSERELGVTILLAGVQDDLAAIMRNVGMLNWFPAEQIFPEEEDEYSATLKAVRYAHRNVEPYPKDDPRYYLV